MRTLLLTAASIVALAVTAPAQVDSAHAATFPRAAIGVTAKPDRRPADPRAPMLKRVAGSSAANSVAPPSVEKPQPFGISSPPHSAALSAAQRQKLADAPAAREAAEASGVIGLKPAEHSTIGPLEAGARSVSIEKRMLPDPRPLTTRPAVRAGASSFSQVLGVIPRPEWSAGLTPAKPKDVSTIGTVPNDPSPRPAASELQRPGAPTAKAPVRTKPPEVSTSAPRDPSLPPASATKAISPESAKQEVRP